MLLDLGYVVAALVAWVALAFFVGVLVCNCIRTDAPEQLAWREAENDDWFADAA